jgi:23S rRNA (adenine2503-C2)-methyltransferase
MEFCSLTFEELKSWLITSGEPPFRAEQIFDWVYRKGIGSFQEMTNLKVELREKLAKEFLFPCLKLVQTQESAETTKFLWELPDRKKIESVLIFSFDRRTVCLSSQVGCPARCAFCASGKEGLIRCLSTGEIVEQALQINQFLKGRGERVSHLVYMGMGEPLENYDAVIRSINIFNSPQGLHLSQRRITVSTVGIIEGIERLSNEPDLRINLVLSLHAPNQHLRKKLIPFARKYPLEELLHAMMKYAAKTRRDPTFEYTLIAQLNDGEEHARELAALLQGKQCTVNLIPYNPVQGLRLARPDKKSVIRFREILEEGGITTTWRYTKGDDIAAACGQLALIREQS